MTSNTESATELGELVLSQRAGAPVKLMNVERIGADSDAFLIRGVTSDTTFLPSRPVVIKVFPERGQDQDSLFVREVVGYQFVGSLDTEYHIGPELIGYDLSRRVLVLSDLGEAQTLDDILNRGVHSDEASDALCNLASVIGRMQVMTAGREDDFHALLRVAQTKAQLPDVPFSSQLLADNLASLPELLSSRLEISLSPQVVERAERCTRRALQGSYRAFSAAELFPENILSTTHGIRLLDFALCGYRDIGVDIAAVLLGFPSDSNLYTLNNQQIDSVVEAWVQQVAPMWPRMWRHQSSRKRILDGAFMWTWLSAGWAIDEEGSLDSGLTNDVIPSVSVLLTLAQHNLECLCYLANYWEDRELAQHAEELQSALERHR